MHMIDHGSNDVYETHWTFQWLGAAIEYLAMDFKETNYSKCFMTRSSNEQSGWKTLKILNIEKVKNLCYHYEYKATAQCSLKTHTESVHMFATQVNGIYVKV